MTGRPARRGRGTPRPAAPQPAGPPHAARCAPAAPSAARLRARRNPLPAPRIAPCRPSTQSATSHIDHTHNSAGCGSPAYFSATDVWTAIIFFYFTHRSDVVQASYLLNPTVMNTHLDMSYQPVPQYFVMAHLTTGVPCHSTMPTQAVAPESGNDAETHFDQSTAGIVEVAMQALACMCRICFLNRFSVPTW